MLLQHFSERDRMQRKADFASGPFAQGAIKVGTEALRVEAGEEDESVFHGPASSCCFTG